MCQVIKKQEEAAKTGNRRNKEDHGKETSLYGCKAFTPKFNILSKNINTNIGQRPLAITLQRIILTLIEEQIFTLQIQVLT